MVCGPSRCPMCNKEEETMNHLFNTCESKNLMWNWAENTLQQTDRTRESIYGTIKNWRGNFSSNKRVNIIWKIVPGLITWIIWKERNMRVFLNETRDINHSIEIIIQNIRQLVHVKSKVDQDNKASNWDLQILKSFNLDNGTCVATVNRQREISTTLSIWKHPPLGFLKLNFYGASGGNPGMAGIGGIIRNSEGKIWHIYNRALGEGTNNEMEFAAMEQGLRILRNLQAGTAVVEGDS